MGGDYASLEAEAGDFRQTVAQLGHGAHLAREADFADGGEVGADGHVLPAGGHGQQRGEVRGGLVQLQAADDVYVCVAARDAHAAALFQHREQQHCAVVVDAVGVAAGVAVAGLGHEGLNLGQYWPRALHDAGHAGARSVQRAAGEHGLRGVRHLAQAGVGHLKDAYLVRGAETVLRRAEDAVAQALLALEVEHAVDHVLEYLGARNVALLVYVAHDEGREAVGLGEAHDGHRALAHLAYAAGRGGDLGVEHRLDGVHDDHGGLQVLDLRLYLRELGLCEDVESRPPRRRGAGRAS